MAFFPERRPRHLRAERRLFCAHRRISISKFVSTRHQRHAARHFFRVAGKIFIITPVSVQANNPVSGAVFMTSTSVNGNLPNGVTIFPGGFPLYRNGVLIGAVGVSGDGVDQDDLISASGAALFLAPVPIRADQTQYRGALLPFAKFPRNPAM